MHQSHEQFHGEQLLQQQNFREKYLNALNLINQYQEQIKELKQHINELQCALEQTQGDSQNGGIQDYQRIVELEKQVNKYKDQKQKTKLSMDRLKLQLEQKKTQLALLHEKRAENELTLKKEKKALLENFIKVREENKRLAAAYASIMNQHNNFMVDPSESNNDNNFIIQNFEDEQQMEDYNNGPVNQNQYTSDTYAHQNLLETS